MPDDGKQLIMTFDPNTIDHFGIKMYSQLPNAFAELVANAFDADASQVAINLYDQGGKKRVEVIDNGMGMEFEEINRKFLRIGRPRRRDETEETPLGRKVTGKKGLGKLALFGLANQITVITSTLGKKTKTEFTLDWNQLQKIPENESYLPKFSETETDKGSHGTTIILNQLNRRSGFDAQALAVSLSKLFDCFDDNFQCEIRLNGSKPVSVNSKLRYENLDKQFEWLLPDFGADIEYKHKDDVRGLILSTRKPLPPGLRGISLFARGRLVNAAEFFGRSESSYVYSYITGWLNVDFIDDLEHDVISTNRQSISWEYPETVELWKYLRSLLANIANDWRGKRTKENTRDITRDLGFDVEEWRETLPDEIREYVTIILNMLSDAESGVSDDKGTEVVRNLHRIIPNFPKYHWRHLHPSIREVSSEYYQNELYYAAVTEAAKAYIDAVRQKSGSTVRRDYLMMNIFKRPTQQEPCEFLSVTEGVEGENRFGFSEETFKNIQKGHLKLSKGVVMGYRNPMAHRVNRQLKESGLITEKDCLDALSIISHLFRRLDESTMINTAENQEA